MLCYVIDTSKLLLYHCYQCFVMLLAQVNYYCTIVTSAWLGLLTQVNYYCTIVIIAWLCY